jgi:hypothetical protein
MIYDRLLLLPLQNTLYTEYFGTRANIAYNYKLDSFPRKRLGEALNAENGCPFLAQSSFVKSGNNTLLIGYDLNGVSIVKYLIQDNGVSLLESVSNDISFPNMRLSSNGQ